MLSSLTADQGLKSTGFLGFTLSWGFWRGNGSYHHPRGGGFRTVGSRLPENTNSKYFSNHIYIQCRSGSRRRVPRSTATKGRILTGIVSSLTWSRWCQSALIWERMEPSKLSTRTLSGSLLLLIKWHTRAMGRPLGKNLSVSWSVSQSVTGTFIFSQGDRGKAKPYYQSPTYASSMICKFFYSVEKSGFVVKW